MAYAIRVEGMKDEQEYDEFVVNLPLHPDAPKRTSPKAMRRLMGMMGGPRRVARQDEHDPARPPQKRKRPIGGSGE